LASPCDSNVLLKVSPDRVCKQWLACRSYIKDENDNNVCYDVGLCDRYSQSGDCANFVVSSSTSQTFEPGNPPNLNIGDIADMTGYTLVGHEKSNESTDFYSLASMDQSGEVALVPNGNFELYGENDYPLGWTVSGGGPWDRNLFSVIDNPYDAQIEGIEYPVDGKSFLKFSPSASIAESEFIDVEPNTEYIMTGSVNTMNFHPGGTLDTVNTGFTIKTYGKDGNPSINTNYPGAKQGHDFNKCIRPDGVVQQQPWHNSCTAYTQSGYDWQNLKLQFQIGASTTKIKIQLIGAGYYQPSGTVGCCDKILNDEDCPNEADGDFNYYGSSACTNRDTRTIDPMTSWGCQNFTEPFDVTITAESCAGNVYFDDLKIKPVLNNKDKDNIAQSCRLYPEEEALSCEYFDDSGMLVKGWPGYCLQHDRYPGSEDACVMWYPADRIEGDSIIEGAGYRGRYPIYYCLDAKADFDFVEERHRVLIYHTKEESDCGFLTVLNFLTLGLISVPNEDWEVNGGPCQGCGCGGEDDSVCPDGYYRHLDQEEDGCDWFFFGSQEYEAWLYCIPEEVELVASVDTDWYIYNSDLQNINGVENQHWNEGSTGVKIYDYDLNKVFDSEDYMVQCSHVVQTVSNSGSNKIWAGRTNEGSAYIADEGGLDYIYSTIHSPFGSMKPPPGDYAYDPYSWNSFVKGAPLACIEDNNGAGDKCGVSGFCDKSELFCTETYNKNASYVCSNPLNRQLISGYDCPSGEECVYGGWDGNNSYNDSLQIVKRLFAQSYGAWEWNSANEEYEDYNLFWSPPAVQCPGNIRPVCVGDACWTGPDNDNCGITPEIDNIKVEDVATTITIESNGFINLTFTSLVDVEQQPLVKYAVDWGDNEKTVVSGAEMHDRPNPENPHSIYHLYSYWDLLAKNSSDQDDPLTVYNENEIYCGNGNINSPTNYDNDEADIPEAPSENYCAVQPRIKIKDNWGWCNNRFGDTPCPAEGYEEFGGWIIVPEKD
ncbi:hypothetical protein DRH27_04885, partial [Candidatus Falkowbacteria bacterium]